jgi:thioesterase domain-containing protein
LGFFQGLRALLAVVKAALPADAKLTVTGHSLGGAEARDMAALCIRNGITVVNLVTFGSPKPAFINLARIIQKSDIRHVSYRNRNDPVPLMPIKVELLDWDWEHTEDWLPISAAPAADDLEPLRDHHIALYLTAVANYPVSGPVIRLPEAVCEDKSGSPQPHFSGWRY